MADNNSDMDRFQEQIDKVSDILERFGGELTGISKSIGKSKRAADVNNSSQEEFAKSLQSVIEELDGGQKLYKDTFEKFGKSGSKVVHSFKTLQESVDNIATQNEQYDAQKLLNEKRKEYILSRSKDLIIEGFSQAGSAALTFTKSLQEATPSVSSGTALLGTAIGVAGSAGSTLGGILSNAGAALAVMPGLGTLVGTGLAVAGGALSTFSEQTSKLLQTANEIFSAEFKKTEAAFYSLNASGAVFADGMTGMKTAANSAGLTLDIFSNIVKNNAETIAKSGFGVADGAVKIGKILNREGGQLRTSLLNLGFSVEEQAELTAMTMRDMRIAGKTLTSTDAQVAQQTKEYASNLRLISSITGEDAKAKMEQARQASTNIAFQAKLAKMDETQKANVIAAMAAMTEIQRKNFMDTVLFGSIINREGAAMAATIPAMAQANTEYAQQFRDGTMSAAKTLETTAKYSEQQQQQLLTNGQALGLAAAAGVSGLGATIGEALAKELQNLLPVTKDAVSKSTDSIAASLETTDKLTQEFTGVVNNMLQSSVNMEKLFLESGGLQMYSQIVSKTAGMMTEVTQMMLDANGMLKQILGGNTTAAVSSGDISKLSTQELMAEKETLTKAYEDIGWFTRNFGDLTESQEKLVARYGELETLINKRIRDNERGVGPLDIGAQKIGREGSANGNILKGPESGYKALLHGVEAVVPLPDGRNMPVEISGNINSGLSREDRSILQNMARIEDIVALKDSIENQQRNLREMTDLFARAVDVLGEHRDISREMLHVLY